MRGQSPPLRLRDCTVVDAQHGVYLAPRDDVVTEHLETRGAHTRPYLAMALAMIRSGDTVFDIGAHIGSFTIPFARAVGPSGRVFAFEPNAQTRELLEINSELNDLANIVETVPVAVGREDANYTIAVDRRNTGAAHLLRIDGPATDAVGTTLDHWVGEARISSIDFIKLDVEGMEVEVLDGAGALLERTRPTLLVEVDSSQLSRYESDVGHLDDLLLALGYRIFVHTGARNAARDEYDAAEIPHLVEGEMLYDVLAVHAASDRLPTFMRGSETRDRASVVSESAP